MTEFFRLPPPPTSFEIEQAAVAETNDRVRNEIEEIATSVRNASQALAAELNSRMIPTEVTVYRALPVAPKRRLSKPWEYKPVPEPKETKWHGPSGLDGVVVEVGRGWVISTSSNNMYDPSVSDKTHTHSITLMEDGRLVKSDSLPAADGTILGQSLVDLEAYPYNESLTTQRGHKNLTQNTRAHSNDATLQDAYLFANLSAIENDLRRKGRALLGIV